MPLWVHAPLSASPLTAAFCVRALWKQALWSPAFKARPLSARPLRSRPLSTCLFEITPLQRTPLECAPFITSPLISHHLSARPNNLNVWVYAQCIQILLVWFLKIKIETLFQVPLLDLIFDHCACLRLKYAWCFVKWVESGDEKFNQKMCCNTLVFKPLDWPGKAKQACNLTSLSISPFQYKAVCFKVASETHKRAFWTAVVTTFSHLNL